MQRRGPDRFYCAVCDAGYVVVSLARFCEDKHEWAAEVMAEQDRADLAMWEQCDSL